MNCLPSNPIGNELAVSANKKRHLSVLISEFSWPGRKVYYPKTTHPVLFGIQLFCMNVGNGHCIRYLCSYLSQIQTSSGKGQRQTSRICTNIAIELNNSQPWRVCLSTKQWTSSLHPFCHTKHTLSLWNSCAKCLGKLALMLERYAGKVLKRSSHHEWHPFHMLF